FFFFNDPPTTMTSTLSLHDALPIYCRRIADLIGPLIENIVLLQRERRRRQRLAALTHLTGVFGTSLKITEVLPRLAEAVRPVLDFDVMGAGLIEPPDRTLQLLAAVDDDRPVDLE